VKKVNLQNKKMSKLKREHICNDTKREDDARRFVLREDIAKKRLSASYGMRLRSPVNAARNVGSIFESTSPFSTSSGVGIF